MGLSSIKVYQLPYESLEKPEDFLKLATNALTFLRSNANAFSSATVHIWISFVALFRGQTRILMPNADFVTKFAEIITEISQAAHLPIFVNILRDARFLGSQSSIVSMAEELARILKEKGIIHSTNERFWKQIYACGREPFYWKEGEGKEVIWAMLEKSLMRQKVFLHCAMDHDTVHDLNEECVHVKNTGFDIETIKRCTEHPRVIPSIRAGEVTDAQAGSANIIGGMKHMKDAVQRRAWSDIRRGVFTPEPLTDVDEHWVEVTEDSELMCDVCKGFPKNDSRLNTCTENRTRCLNCVSNWTRAAIYGTDDIGMDEFSQDARVAARLLNIYNECVDWREMEAEKDLRGFLVTATLAMLSGYRTTSDVLKQVSHRGAIRMPAYMVKGKCRRDLLPQFTVQRETRTEDCGGGMHRMRWFYRLLWDGGNVAYHDYMKTVLTKEEIESMINPNATAEYVGDIFEFWLGMLDLGIQFPTMFAGWGANLDSCLAGLEEVVLAIQQFMSTYRHHQHKAKPIQESIHPAGREWHGDYYLERSRNFWPTHAEEDHQNAGAPRSQLRWPPWNDWGLIKRWRGGWSWWTWWGDHDAYSAGPSSRTNFRRNRCRSWWHRDWGGGRWHGGTTFRSEEAPNRGAWHPWSFWEADFRCIGCSILFHLWWKAWHWRMYYTRWWEHEGHHMAHEVDHGSEVQIPIIIRKIPKLQPEAEKTSSQRTSCHEESVGEEPDSLRKRKWPSASTVSQPLCTTLVIVKKEDNT